MCERCTFGGYRAGEGQKKKDKLNQKKQKNRNQWSWKKKVWWGGPSPPRNAYGETNEKMGGKKDPRQKTLMGRKKKKVLWGGGRKKKGVFMEARMKPTKKIS